MTRLHLLAALVIVLGAAIGAPSARAYDCPRPTVQLSADESSEVRSSVDSLGGLNSTTFDKKSAQVTQDLFSKYPHADDVALANTMISMFCQIILPSTMSDAEKLDQLYRLEDRITGHASVSVPMNPAVAPTCSTNPKAVLAPIMGLFTAWQELDVDLYLAQWGPDAIARSEHYVYRIADFTARRRADFTQYRAVTVSAINPSIVYVDATKANVVNTYTMHFVRTDGRTIDERGVKESYVLECVARDKSWRIRENNDYQ
jgi:hypothetical protein